MVRFLTLAILVLMGACAQLPRTAAGAPFMPSARWMIGGWVPEGQSCESDAGVIYRQNGTWAAYGVSGTWRINGSTVVFLVTEDDEDPKVSVGKPVRHSEQIKVLGPDRYQTRGDDGKVLTLRRCPQARG